MFPNEADFFTKTTIGCIELQSHKLPLYRVLLSRDDLMCLESVVEKDERMYGFKIDRLFHIAGIRDFPTTDASIVRMQNMLKTKECRRDEHERDPEYNECFNCVRRLFNWFGNYEQLQLQYQLASYVFECYSRYSKLAPIPYCLTTFFTYSKTDYVVASGDYYNHVFTKSTFSEDTKKAIFLLYCRGESCGQTNLKFLSQNLVSVVDGKRKAKRWKLLEHFEKAFTGLLLYSKYFPEEFTCTSHQNRKPKGKKRIKLQHKVEFLNMNENYVKFAEWANVNHVATKDCNFCKLLLWRICTQNVKTDAKPPACLEIAPREKS